MSNDFGNTQWWQPSNEKFLKKYNIHIQEENVTYGKTTKLSIKETAISNCQKEKEGVENNKPKTNACEKVNNFLENFFILTGMISGIIVLVFSLTFPFIWFSEELGREKAIDKFLIYLLVSIPVFIISWIILAKIFKKGYIIKF